MLSRDSEPLEVTPRRQLVVNVIRQAGRPLTAEDVLRLAQKRCPGLGIATVYRALKDLKRAQCVNVVHVPDHGVYYEPADSESHDHIYCAECDHVHCVFNCRISIARSELSEENIASRSLLLYGRCATCAQKGHKC